MKNTNMSLQIFIIQGEFQIIRWEVKTLLDKFWWCQTFRKTYFMSYYWRPNPWSEEEILEQTFCNYQTKKRLKYVIFRKSPFTIW